MANMLRISLQLSLGRQCFSSFVRSFVADVMSKDAEPFIAKPVSLCFWPLIGGVLERSQWSSVVKYGATGNNGQSVVKSVAGRCQWGKSVTVAFMDSS